MIIFLDESGDLGFDLSKKGASRKFVIALLVCEDEAAARAIQIAVKRTLKNKLNHKKSKSRFVHELKGTGTTIDIKKYFYRHLPTRGWKVYTVALNKARVDTHLTDKAGKKKLYNFLSHFILKHVPLSATHGVRLVVDKSKNSAEMKDFNGYLESQLEAMMPLKSKLYINHERSQENTGLQAVDLFCWGVYRKHEHSDNEWYQVYESDIAFETEYLK
ncbi:DUF3800 domain-containing protein [Mariprofundus ferrooxydans]|nr:DUF3800 domain-containing protein [Mariprofundus ferrooxydans]